MHPAGFHFYSQLRHAISRNLSPSPHANSSVTHIFNVDLARSYCVKGRKRRFFSRWPLCAVDELRDQFATLRLSRFLPIDTGCIPCSIKSQTAYTNVFICIGIYSEESAAAILHAMESGSLSPRSSPLTQAGTPRYVIAHHLNIFLSGSYNGKS